MTLVMEAATSLDNFSSRPLQAFITRPVSASPEDSISKVLGFMVSKRVQEVLVDGEPGAGLVTLRNILRARDLAGRKLSSLVVKPPSLKPTDTVAQAAKAMSDLRVRTLPILDVKGKLAGSLSSASILQELGKMESVRMRVSDIMTPRPITIDTTTSLDKARSIMVKNDIDHLPVTHGQDVVGIVTSLDLVSVLGPSERDNRLSKTSEPSSKGEGKVAGILTRPPITCKPTDDSISVLKTILSSEGTAAVAVSDRVQGIVTLRDYMKILSPREPATLPVYVVGLPKEEPESPMAEARFRGAVQALVRVYPDMEEARATVKTKTTQGRKIERKLFQVQVLVQMPRERFDFTEEGWSLADVFENIALKLKRLRTKPEKKESYGKRLGRGQSPEEFS